MVLYYQKATGYICEQLPHFIERDDTSLSIEVSDEIYNQTLCCDLGKIWAVKDGQVVMIDDPDVDSIPGYKKSKLETEKQNLQNYLISTDYIVIKLYDTKIYDEDSYESEKTKYLEILEKRKESRTRINAIEEELEILTE